MSAQSGPTPEPPPEVDWSWTATESTWVPPDIDHTKPSPARMYDYALDGKDNFAVDRAAIAQVAELVPGFREVAKANRAFLVHAVTTMAAQGISQFMDIGAGLPTAPNVHEVAQQVHPDARVVYVDNDPIVMAHNRALRSRTPGVLTLHHDMRQPEGLLSDPLLRQHLDFTQPIGLLFIAVLHFVRRDVAVALVKQFLRAMPEGSFVAISAVCAEGMSRELSDRLEMIYTDAPVKLVIRTSAEIEQLFEGIDILAPGLRDVSSWAGHDKPLPMPVLGGVGTIKTR